MDEASYPGKIVHPQPPDIFIVHSDVMHRINDPLLSNCAESPRPLAQCPDEICELYSPSLALPFILPDFALYAGERVLGGKW
ncbi:hypothetical protein TNCV_2423271 [Trichonephila clavipes]|nr:hypothetical protein TNCV_2423271 [Trichonephila clavipes]